MHVGCIHVLCLAHVYRMEKSVRAFQALICFVVPAHASQNHQQGPFGVFVRIKKVKFRLSKAGLAAYSGRSSSDLSLTRAAAVMVVAAWKHHQSL